MDELLRRITGVLQSEILTMYAELKNDLQTLIATSMEEARHRPRFMTSKEVQRYLGLNDLGLNRLLADGELTVLDIAGKPRFDAIEVKRWAEKPKERWTA